MSDNYRQLLDAAIQHVEELKARGVRHVAVAPETLRALALPPAKFPTSNFQTPIEKTFTLPAEKIVTPVQSEITPTAAPQSAIRNPQSAMEKSAAFAALRERALACVKCPHLASSRKNVVFGVGSIDAQLMFVGEAPGADEDEQGEPFVGKAGQLLTKIIQATGLSRGGRLYCEHFEMPARHARPVRRQPQADAGRNADVHSVFARAD